MQIMLFSILLYMIGLNSFHHLYQIKGINGRTSQQWLFEIFNYVNILQDFFGILGLQFSFEYSFMRTLA